MAGPPPFSQLRSMRSAVHPWIPPRDFAWARPNLMERRRLQLKALVTGTPYDTYAPFIRSRLVPMQPLYWTPSIQIEFARPEAHVWQH
jgi:hypothetical protein